MSQSSQRTVLGSFTIAVDRAGTDTSSQMSLQHIVKPTAADKTSDAILVTDLDINKFILILMMDIQYDMDLDQISYQLPDTDLTEILSLNERVWQTTINTIYNRLSRTSQTEIKFTMHPYIKPFRTEPLRHLLGKVPPLIIADAVSDVDLLPERKTFNSNCTIDVEQENLLMVKSPPRTIKGWRWALVVSAILSSVFLFNLDTTIVADIQPAIAETFEDVGKLPWLGVAFLLGAASTNLIWAKAYGKFNAKWTYIFSFFLFQTGSAICGTANSMSVFIVGRAVCGVGGVGLYIGVMTLLSMTTSIRERPNYIAFTGIVWGLGTVLGPVVGGAFADSTATWRWAFYINLCLGGAFVPIYILLLPSIDPTPGMQSFKRFKEMDLLGGILLICAFISGIMAISFGGTLYLWKSAQIIGCFLISGTSFTLFGFQQAYAFLTTKEQRIFPVDFLKSRTMVLLFCLMSCASAGLVIPLYMVPLLFQFTRSDTALNAALHLLPFVFVSTFACLLNGVIMGRYGYYMPWYLAAGIFTTIGAILMSVVSENTSTSQIYGSTILLGFGVGLVLQASFSVAQASVPVRKISDAVGFITCAQVSSLTISLAIANSVFLNEAQNLIGAFLPDVPLSTIQGAIAGVGSKLVETLPSETRHLVLGAIVQSIGKVYILGISAGVFLILLSLGLRREQLFLTVGVIA